MSSLGDEYYDIDSILAEHEVRNIGISGLQYGMILMVRLVLMFVRFGLSMVAESAWKIQ